MKIELIFWRQNDEKMIDKLGNKYSEILRSNVCAEIAGRRESLGQWTYTIYIFQNAL
jgi:hypothetical protein